MKLHSAWQRSEGTLINKMTHLITLGTKIMTSDDICAKDTDPEKSIEVGMKYCMDI